MAIAYIIIGLFGLCFGSFLNVCISRLPRGESIVFPRSHCPRCNHAIRWYDNIPLISYLVLRARCRDCHAPISPLYPTVEALTALVLVLTFHVYGLGPEFIKYALFSMLLIVLIFTDLLDRRIPHAVTIFGICLGLVFSFFIPVDDRPLGWILRHWDIYLEGFPASVAGAVAGALVGGGLFYAVGEAFYRLGGKQKEYLGFGDVMLMLMVGTFLGVPLTLMTILLGSLGGSIIALGMSAVSSRFRGYAWPYGTFLGIAAIYAGLNGDRLLDCVFTLVGNGRLKMNPHYNSQHLMLLFGGAVLVICVLILGVYLLQKSINRTLKPDEPKPAKVRVEDEAAFTLATVKAVITQLKAEQKATQEKLLAAERRAEENTRKFDLLAREIDYGLMIFDAEGFITFSNPLVRKLLAVDTWSRRRYGEIFHDVPALSNLIGECVETGAETRKKICRIPRLGRK